MRRSWVAVFVAGLLSLAWPAEAQVVRQLTDARTGLTALHALDEAGTWVWAISASDPLGTNPRHVFQVFRWHVATGIATQVTFFADGVEPRLTGPTVTDDGERLAFISHGNLTGQNHDESPELFVMAADGSDLLQLTHSPAPRDGSVLQAALSGDGNRVVFASDADYLGGNPDRNFELWIVDTDGSDLRQLTDGQYWGDLRGPSISDDGERIVFSGADANTSVEIFGVLADGTGLRPITTNDQPTSHHPRISGDGSTVVYVAPPAQCSNVLGYGNSIRAIDWDGTGETWLAEHYMGDVVCGSTAWPDVTDDGQIVFYAGFEFGEWDIWRVNRDGSGYYTLRTNDVAPDCTDVAVAGGGSRIAFHCGDELYAKNASGSGLRQLSSGTIENSRQPDVTPDGTRIVFASEGNEGTPSAIHRIAPDGSDLVALTGAELGTVKEPAISDDGSRIVFAASGDPFGTNPSGVFQIFSVLADGSSLRQLSFGTYPQAATRGTFNLQPPDSDSPDIGGNGGTIVFRSMAGLTSPNPSFIPRIYEVQWDGTGLTQLGEGARPRIDGNGAQVVWESMGNPLGLNPDGRLEVFVRRTDLSGFKQVTASPYPYQSSRPDISAAGDVIVYQSDADPLGGNADHNYEIFSTAPTKQLTATTTGSNANPSISRDGTTVYFTSSSSFFEAAPAGEASLFELDVETHVVERVGALIPCENQTDARPVVTNQDGTLAVFAAGRDCVGQNPDGHLEIHVIDRQATPRIHVSRETPTVVSWDAASGPIRYDVVRGDVANLQLAGNGEVDLGPVVCLEDDSPDTDTAGAEDPALPTAGQAFFYLFRGSQGLAAGSGSYGHSSAGQERVAGPGACDD